MAQRTRRSKAPTSLEIEAADTAAPTRQMTPGTQLRDSFNINSPKGPRGSAVKRDSQVAVVGTELASANRGVAHDTRQPSRDTGRYAAAAYGDDEEDGREMSQPGSPALHSDVHPRLADLSPSKRAVMPTASDGNSPTAPRKGGNVKREETPPSSRHLTPPTTSQKSGASVGSSRVLPATPTRHDATEADGIPAALASLLHQSDKHGKQQKASPVIPPQQPDFSAGMPSQDANHKRRSSATNAARILSVPQLPPPPRLPGQHPIPQQQQQQQATPALVTTTANTLYHPYGMPQPVGNEPSASMSLWSRLCCVSINDVDIDAQSLPSVPPRRSTQPMQGTKSAAAVTLPMAPTYPHQVPSASNGDARGLSASARMSHAHTGNGALVKQSTQRINNVRRLSSALGDGPLLGPVLECDATKPCLVLDLDETLVHSSFKPIPNPDYIIPVDIEGFIHHVYVCKRPGCDEFMRRCGQKYEIVVFTASLAKYADPLLDLLDIYNVVHARLFREACVYHEGNYVKDLSILGRDPMSTIIVDNSPASYMFQPENALPCSSFIDDPNDDELFILCDFLEAIDQVDDLRQALFHWVNGTFHGLQSLQQLDDSASQSQSHRGEVVASNESRRKSVLHEDERWEEERINVQESVSVVSNDMRAARKEMGASMVSLPIQPTNVKPAITPQSNSSSSRALNRPLTPQAPSPQQGGPYDSMEVGDDDHSELEDSFRRAQSGTVTPSAVTATYPTDPARTNQTFRVSIDVSILPSPSQGSVSPDSSPVTSKKLSLPKADAHNVISVPQTPQDQFQVNRDIRYSLNSPAQMQSGGYTATFTTTPGTPLTSSRNHRPDASHNTESDRDDEPTLPIASDANLSVMAKSKQRKMHSPIAPV